MRPTSYSGILGCWMVDFPILSQLSTGQQAQGLSSIIHANSAPGYGGGIAGTNPSNPSAVVAIFSEAERASGRTESIWGNNSVVVFKSIPSTSSAYAYEGDVSNGSGSDASGSNGGVAYNAIAAGAQSSFAGLSVGGSSTAGTGGGLGPTGVGFENGVAIISSLNGLNCGAGGASNSYSFRCITGFSKDGLDFIYAERQSSAITGKFFHFQSELGADVAYLDEAGDYYGKSLTLSSSATVALSTSAIGAHTCKSTGPTSLTGATTGSAIAWSFASTPIGVTGYGDTVTPFLVVTSFVPSTGSVTFVVCNTSSSSITPGAISVNARAIN